jgi:hypothetical protein
MKHEGVKHDGEKVRLDLIPHELIFGVGNILSFGADKYGARNWELGMNWGRPFAAMMRHMWAWWRGEKLDPETGKSHLWHAACCVAFLMAYEERGIGTDDRPGARPQAASTGEGGRSTNKDLEELKARAVRLGIKTDVHA